MMEVPKVIVRYLPQFHQIPENDRWWGAGFTEWTAVRKAEALYEKHDQPRVPFEGDYYNLLDKRTMIWQATLGKQYGIGCFSFYHYWFKNGRQILEKPAENLLHWKDVQMPFCFTWANETWARTWSKLNQKNAWADSFEADDGNIEESDGILLKQKYGDEHDWREHFLYLVPFFKDDRYLKKDNKPVFIIYLPESIPRLLDMVECWNQWSIEIGFAGIYFIGEASVKYELCNAFDALDAQVIRFPNAALSKMKATLCNGIRMYNYDECWKIILQEQYENGKQTYLCGVVDYDTTPRKGHNGEILKGACADKFKLFFKQFVKQNMKMGNEYVFLNAWNEWGEGMYLEPDVSNGYGYLEAIKSALVECAFLSQNDLSATDAALRKEDIHWLENRLVKMTKGFKILSEWLHLKEHGKRIDSYLLDKGYQNIAVYGLGVMGEHLIAELGDSKVTIQYIIDRKAGGMKNSLHIYGVQEALPPVDAIIVTPNGQYGGIKKTLMACGIRCPILPLEEIVLENE